MSRLAPSSRRSSVVEAAGLPAATASSILTHVGNDGPGRGYCAGSSDCVGGGGKPRQAEGVLARTETDRVPRCSRWPLAFEARAGSSGKQTSQCSNENGENRYDGSAAAQCRAALVSQRIESVAGRRSFRPELPDHHRMADHGYPAHAARVTSTRRSGVSRTEMPYSPVASSVLSAAR